MADQPKRFFDVWYVQANNVVKEVPFHVVTDWIQQGRVTRDDRIKPSGTADWYPLGSVVAFEAYFPQPERLRADDASEAMEPVEMEFDWKSSSGDEDDDVDMIPLIDISLVLLIFFMMTTTVASLSRIEVPLMEHATSVETNPGVVRIDIDLVEGRRIYAVGLGTQPAAPEDSNLQSDVELMARLDARLANVTVPPKARIAAHSQVEYRYVAEVLDSLERRRTRGQFSDVTVEVGERSK